MSSINTNYTNDIHFTDDPNQQNLHSLIHACWSVAYTSLWNTCTFSTSEKEYAMQAIKKLLVTAKDVYKEAIRFCERVLLAKEYINCQAGRFIPLPTVWFNSNNDKGYAGTKKWHDHLLSVRASLPLHKIEYKAFAEAALEMMEDARPEIFAYWKSYFTEKRTPVLLQLFMATVANSQFGNFMN